MDDDKKILCAVIIALFVLIYFVVGSALTKRYENNKVYAEGIEAFEAGDYDKVLEILQPLGDYKEAAKYIEYSKAVKALKQVIIYLLQGLLLNWSSLKIVTNMH